MHETIDNLLIPIGSATLWWVFC